VPLEATQNAIRRSYEGNCEFSHRFQSPLRSVRELAVENLRDPVGSLQQSHDPLVLASNKTAECGCLYSRFRSGECWDCAERWNAFMLF